MANFQYHYQVYAMDVIKCNCLREGFKKQNPEKVWLVDKFPLDKCPKDNFQGGQVPPGQVPVQTSSPNFPPVSKNDLALICTIVLV